MRSSRLPHREYGAVLAGIKAAPFRWSATSLDHDSGSGSGSGSGSPTPAYGDDA